MRVIEAGIAVNNNSFRTFAAGNEKQREPTRRSDQPSYLPLALRPH